MKKKFKIQAEEGTIEIDLSNAIDRAQKSGKPIVLKGDGEQMTISPTDDLHNALNNYAETLSRFPDNKGKLSDISNYVDRGGVMNFTRIGQAIYNTAKESLCDMVKRHNTGWFDGGCYVFAKAVKTFLDEDLNENPTYSAIVRESNNNFIYDHIVIRVVLSETGYDDVYIDADGIMSKKDMLQKFIDIEGLKGEEYFIKDFIPISDVTNRGDIVVAPQFSEEIRKTMQEMYTKRLKDKQIYIESSLSESEVPLDKNAPTPL